MNKYEIRKAFTKLILLLVVGVFILLCVVGFYIYSFHSNPISTNPADWGSFGDFLGGILNPIISLYSLVLLGFISYYIAKDSNNESNELNLRMRRMDAYNELTQHLPSLDRVVITLSDSIEILKNNSMDNSFETFQFIRNKMERPTQQFIEYDLYLKDFDIRYAFISIRF